MIVIKIFACLHHGVSGRFSFGAVHALKRVVSAGIRRRPHVRLIGFETDLVIIGENARNDDMPVNPCRAKKLSNMRSTGDGKGVSLSPPLVMTLERSLEYIAPDEYVEVTPKSLRLRKEILDANGRKRAGMKIG